MIKNYIIRSTIIGIFQILLPIAVLLVLAPWFINTQVINHLQKPGIHPWFIVLHALFYLTLILVWPKLVRRLNKQNPINAEQLKTVLRVRWNLLASILFIDALMLLRSL